MNLRALTFVAALVIAIAAVTVMARQHDSGPGAATFTDRIAVHGEQNSERQPSGLELRLTESGISLTAPSCNLDGLDVKFFMHVYTENSQGTITNEYINRDFDFLNARMKRTTTNAGSQCVVERSFDTTHAREVVIGQFVMPEGHCCRILWSRNYVIGQ